MKNRESGTGEKKTFHENIKNKHSQSTHCIFIIYTSAVIELKATQTWQ